jgi:hypothetical protein
LHDSLIHCVSGGSLVKAGQNGQVVKC